jgi:preprotein translocase subunit YajC
MEQYSGILLMLGFLAIFYFLIIRPQQKKEKKVKEMRSNLKVGDDVSTIGGIHGKILTVKEDIVVIEVGSDKVKLTMAKWAIGNVLSER